LQITGKFTILNTIVLPLKRICSIYQLANVRVVSAEEYFCKNYQRNQVIEKQSFVRSKINTKETREIEAFIEGPWLSAIIHMSGIDILNEKRKLQIRILSKIHIIRKFQLTPTSSLISFEEHREDEPSSSELVLANNSLDFVSFQCTPLSSIPTFVEDVTAPFVEVVTPTSVDLLNMTQSLVYSRVKQKFSDIVGKKMIICIVHYLNFISIKLIFLYFSYKYFYICTIATFA